MRFRPPSLAGLPQTIREQLERLPDRWRVFRTEFREDPSVLWRHPAARLMAILAGGILLIVVVQWLVSALTPSGGGPIAGERPTPHATLYVACANPDCRASTTTHQPMDFKAWPLPCEKCGQTSVYRATRCAVCRNWIPQAPGLTECSFCRERAAAAKPREPNRPLETTDDSEDPW